MIGAGALVRALKVHPHAIVIGVPGVYAGWVCCCGAMRTRNAPYPSGERLTCPKCEVE